MGPLPSQAVSGIALQFASKKQHFDLNEYKMAAIKSKTDYFGLFRVCGSLTVLEGHYDLSLKPHSGVPSAADRGLSPQRDWLHLKVIFINLHRFQKFSNESHARGAGGSAARLHHFHWADGHTGYRQRERGDQTPSISPPWQHATRASAWSMLVND